MDRLPHNRVRRMPERARYDRETIYPIIDEALICHVAFVEDGRPFVIPTIHARRDDEILLHGAKASRLLKHAASGAELSIAITLLDGVVVARSTFNSSMNYRSAVLFGRGRELTDDAEKNDALERFSEQLIPGRWYDSRPNTEKEIAATSIVAVTIESASAKLRSGGPKDDESELDLPFWAGVIPLNLQPAPPLDDAKLKAGISPPDYIAHYTRKRRS
jgi:uncharacterized protein